MSTAIWNAAAGTPTATHRIPVDTSGAGTPTMYTVQQMADLETSVGTSVNALGSIAVNTAIDLALGGFVSATIGANLTFTFTNPPAGGTEFTLVLTNGGAYTITWPGSVSWAGATAPTLSGSGTDVLRFTSGNGGTNWYGWHERDEALTLGTGVSTALGTNVGTAGSVVVNGGALGTPSSGNLGSCTFPTLNQNTSGYAEALKSASTTVTVSAATAPSSGQVLTATSSTAATWQTPSGGAGTDTFLVRDPTQNQPPASAYATLDTRNSIPCLDFDAAADESAIFSGVAPEGIVLTSGIIARIVWAATSATSGNVRWRVAFERRTTDQDSDSWDTATEATDATNGTSGICEVCEITCTTIDSIVAGDSFRVCVTRVGTDGTNDTMTGDAELFGFELRAA